MLLCSVIKLKVCQESHKITFYITLGYSCVFPKKNADYKNKKRFANEAA